MLLWIQIAYFHVSTSQRNNAWGDDKISTGLIYFKKSLTFLCELCVIIIKVCFFIILYSVVQKVIT